MPDTPDPPRRRPGDRRPSYTRKVTYDWGRRRWQAMTPAEREAWLELHDVPPPGALGGPGLQDAGYSADG